MNDANGYDAWRDGALTIPGLRTYANRHAREQGAKVGGYCLMTKDCPCVTCRRERALWLRILDVTR